MNYHVIVNSVGLFFDIAGAILIFIFGLPPKIDAEGQTYLITGEINKEEKARAKKYKIFGNIGLGFLLAGFILQFVSNFI